MKKSKSIQLCVLVLASLFLSSCTLTSSPTPIETSTPIVLATLTPEIPPTPKSATETPTSTPIPGPINQAIDVVEYQSSNSGDWFTEDLFAIPEANSVSEASFSISNVPIANRRDGEISPSLSAGYIYLQHEISSYKLDKHDHTIKTLFIRSSLMSFVDYENDRVIIPWTLKSEKIPTDVRGIIEFCNKEGIPVFLEANYSDYIPGELGSGMESLQEVDTIANIISYLNRISDAGLHIDGITFGDEWEDEAGYGRIKPTIHNSNFTSRFINFAKAIRSEFPDIKIYAFDSSINAARGGVYKYQSHLNRIRQAELIENMTLVDGFIYRESYVYIDKNGKMLASQLILDDTESLYRDTPVYRYDSEGIKYSNPNRDYLHTIIDMTTEIFNRSLDIGITEYLPAGPYQISEFDTSQYADIDFIIHYSDVIGIYAELGLDIVSKIMFGDSTQMHEAYFDRSNNVGVNYPVYEQFSSYFSGQILQVDQSSEYDEIKVKIYATKEGDKHFIVILNKDVNSEKTIEVNLPDYSIITLRLPKRSYTSLIVEENGITISGIGN